MVDILLVGQWPLNYSGHLNTSSDVKLVKDEFYNSSQSIARLAVELCPRYIYASHSDTFFKRMPYLNAKGFTTRFIALGTLPG